MKILHTSDWHIGKRIYNKDMEEDHKLFFSWLIHEIKKRKTDILIVSGDIFDIAYPSTASLSMYYDVITQLHQTQCKKIIITGGNHDSTGTLNAPNQILQHLRTFVIGGGGGNFEEHIIEVDSEKNDEKCILCAVPYLRDYEIRSSVPGESYDDKAKAIQNGIKAYYDKLSELAKKRDNVNTCLIATGHLFVTGAATTESERDIYIGNLGAIDVSTFPEEFQYVALGHLHRPQIVGKKQHIRYSGSPLPLSFSEKDDKKIVIEIETNGKEITSIQPVCVPNFRKLISFKGSFSEIQEKVKNYTSDSQLTDRAELLMTEEHFRPGIFTEIQEFLEEINSIDIIHYKINFSKQVDTIDSLPKKSESLHDLKVNDVFDKLLEIKNIEEKQELQKTFDELLHFVNDMNTTQSAK